ncbi:EAL domain-containing protein [Caldimonas brevitalea]|uniref:Diguanylate cyclase/phosphodiesterase n=1 Tax=Caldimonas brevitalea TaxID=413882 RepID=A0A0G3BLG7_9BURK|nr:EAL domain-containing protein [Caldimonas brevitalea]AKJ30264.1 diguanylate cyclase/phosphodiesterase [Caldimonas brevitalea]
MNIEHYPADADVFYEDAPCGFLLTTADGTILAANRRFAQWCGRPAEALTAGLRLQDLLAPASRILHETHYAPLLKLQGFAYEVSFDLALPDGQRFPVLVNALRREDSAPGGPTRISITVFNATETRRYERELIAARKAAESAALALSTANDTLSAQKEQLRITLYSIADAVVTTDAAGLVTSMNPAATVLTGSPEARALGQPVQQLGQLFDGATRSPRESPVLACLHAGTVQRGAEPGLLLRGDGAERLIADTAAPIRSADGRVTGAVWVCHDITEQNAASERLDHASRHDTLTGLANRAEFEQRLTQLACDGGLVCHLDLDQFKIINDTLGHVAGDELLRQVAELLRRGVRQSDTLARLGGDEFGLLLSRCPLGRGRTIAESLRERVASFRFRWGDQSHPISVSIGIAELPAGGETSAVLGHADIACHAAKEAGRNQVYCFDENDPQWQHRKGEMGWVPRIQRALDEDRFTLYFQPIVPTQPDPSAPPRGELLLRLRDESGQLLGPGAFIPAAERFQQMQALDRWVVRKAFEWMQRTPGVYAAVNISGQSLGDAAFLAHVVKQFELTGLDASRVCFEITETAAIGNLTAALHFIATLRQLGARFALDDFGAGLSSFAYLKTLPVDYVKIDGSFVKSLAEDALNRAIVESIHRIARLSGLETVAEWVESEAVLQELRVIGVDHAQGWGVGKPVPVESVSARVV